MLFTAANQCKKKPRMLHSRNLPRHGTCHNKVDLQRLYERPFPFLLYACIRGCQTPVCVVFRHPLAKYARFCKAPNQYQKVRIVRYVRGAIDVLPLPCRVFVRAAAVSFSECSSRLVLLRMVYSDYVKQRILVYYRRKKNCAEIARCLAEEGYSVTKVGVAKFLRHYKETLSAKQMLIFSLSKSFVEIHYFTPL